MSFITDLELKADFVWCEGAHTFKCSMSNNFLEVYLVKKYKKNTLKILPKKLKEDKEQEQMDMINKVFKEFGIYPPVEIVREPNGYKDYHIGDKRVAFTELTPYAGMMKEIKRLAAEYLAAKWNIKQ